MMDKEKNGRKPRQPLNGDPKQADVRPYSLETIMALQKALEGGIPAETTPPGLKSRYEPKSAIAWDIPSGLIGRVVKSLAEMGRDLEQGLRSVMGFKKRSKQTSAP